MKNLFLILITLIGMNGFANNYTSETLVIEAEHNRAEVLTTVLGNYIKAKGFPVSIIRKHGVLHNDPTGKTSPGTNGTWAKVYHPYSGTVEYIQMSPKMLRKMIAILNNKTSDIPSVALISELERLCLEDGKEIECLCEEQGKAGERVANQVQPTSPSYVHNDPKPSVDNRELELLKQKNALLEQKLIEQQFVNRAAAPYNPAPRQHQVVTTYPQVQAQPQVVVVKQKRDALDYVWGLRNLAGSVRDIKETFWGVDVNLKGLNVNHSYTQLPNFPANDPTDFYIPGDTAGNQGGYGNPNGPDPDNSQFRNIGPNGGTIAGGNMAQFYAAANRYSLL
jgi:hypothetical protein